MKTLVFLLIVAGIAIIWHRVRMNRLQASGHKLGLTVGDGPALDQREPWMVLSAWVHDWVPTAWGANGAGNFEGKRLQLQEQELRSSIGANRTWHLLVVWTLDHGKLPAFRLRPEQSPGALGRMSAAITTPLSAHLVEGSSDQGFQAVPLGESGLKGWQLLASDPGAARAWWSSVPAEALAALPYLKALGGRDDTLVALMDGQLSSMELDVLIQRCQRLLLFARASTAG